MDELILGYLSLVARERSARSADTGLAAQVTLVKRYQQLRFACTYADMLASERYASAARFFLEELYGPGDFVERDAQFVRIVPKITAMMPGEVVATIRDLAELHAISESLDSAMARAIQGSCLSREDYICAWQLVGQRDQRMRQLQLVLALGRSIDSFSRRSWIHAALRMMRGPAHAAGLASLQAFLELGMSSFRSMHGAGEFLHTVQTREGNLMETLFAANCTPGATLKGSSSALGALMDLPAKA